MKLYHYSTEHYDVLKTRRASGTSTREDIIKAEKASVKFKSVGLYVDHISFFFDPIPSKLLAAHFPKEHHAWAKGTHLYEYVVDTRVLDPKVRYDIVESARKTAYVNSLDWPEEDDPEFLAEYCRNEYALKEQWGEIGTGVKQLDHQIAANKGKTEAAYKELFKSEDWPHVQNKYAANVPHVMLYPTGGCVPFEQVNQLVMGDDHRKPVVAYREGPESTFTYEGHNYSVDHFLERSADLPINQIPVKDCTWVLKYDTPRDDRVKAADPSVPVLYTHDPKWGIVIIDGLHRLQKAVNLHMKTIPGREIPQSWFVGASLEAIETPRVTMLGVPQAVAQAFLKQFGAEEIILDRQPVLNAESSPLRLYYFAMEGDTPSGLVILQNWSRFSPGVWVHPERRGLGIGRTMLDSMLIDQVSVPQAVVGDVAGFFKRLGFSEVGATQQFRLYRRFVTNPGLAIS